MPLWRFEPDNVMSHKFPEVTQKLVEDLGIDQAFCSEFNPPCLLKYFKFIKCRILPNVSNRKDLLCIWEDNFSAIYEFPEVSCFFFNEKLRFLPCHWKV